MTKATIMTTDIGYGVVGVDAYQRGYDACQQELRKAQHGELQRRRARAPARWPAPWRCPSPSASVPPRGKCRKHQPRRQRELCRKSQKHHGHTDDHDGHLDDLLRGVTIHEALLTAPMAIMPKALTAKMTEYMVG